MTRQSLTPREDQRILVGADVRETSAEVRAATAIQPGLVTVMTKEVTHVSRT
jgi:hypothetical protein